MGAVCHGSHFACQKCQSVGGAKAAATVSPPPSDSPHFTRYLALNSFNLSIAHVISLCLTSEKARNAFDTLPSSVFESFRVLAPRSSRERGNGRRLNSPIRRDVDNQDRANLSVIDHCVPVKVTGLEGKNFWLSLMSSLVSKTLWIHALPISRPTCNSREALSNILSV